MKDLIMHKQITKNLINYSSTKTF